LNSRELFTQKSRSQFSDIHCSGIYTIQGLLIEDSNRDHFFKLGLSLYISGFKIRQKMQNLFGNFFFAQRHSFNKSQNTALGIFFCLSAILCRIPMRSFWYQNQVIWTKFDHFFVNPIFLCFQRKISEKSTKKEDFST
jgi:hypothetical protein